MKAIDAVNRADVIDMLEMYPFTEYGEYETAREVVKRLPSAQLEPCGDTVSRKAVEEMLKNGFPARGMWEIEGDVVKQTVCDTLVDALMDLEKLPSTDPEFIRCKDCKYRGEYPITDGRYWCALHDTFMYYCSDAERRTDEAD